MPQFLAPLDMTQVETQNFVLHNLAAEPGTPVPGQMYYDTVEEVVKFAINDGTFLTPTMSASSILAALLTVDGAGSELDADLLDGEEGSHYLDRANHTGTQLAATISDFDAQVDSHSLDELADAAADVGMGGNKLTNLGTPTDAGDAANKGYVDALAQGLDQKPTATVATAAALPACTYDNGTSGVGATLTGDANGALTVDGLAVSAGQRVLVKDQVAGLQNGLYDVTQAGSGGTPFILTRSADMDTTLEFSGAFIPVEDAGTANPNSLWLCTNTAAPTIGTTAITFTQLNRGTDLSAGTGISISGNVVSISGTYAGQTSIVTVGTITTGVWSGTAIAVNKGGTGATTAAAARTALSAVGAYTTTIGNGSATSITITRATHLMAANGTNTVAVYDATTGAQVFPDVTVAPGTGDVTLDFAVAPTTNQYRVVINGVT